MKKIIDKRGTGKTSRLFLLAKENDGVIICNNPANMRMKAYNYGITGIDFVSYADYFYNTSGKVEEFINGRKIYIDELSQFLKFYDEQIVGYTEVEDDE